MEFSLFSELTLSHPSHSRSTFSQSSYREMYIGELVRIGSMIIFHVSKLWKAKFILRDEMFLVSLMGKFDIYHFWE